MNEEPFVPWFLQPAPVSRPLYRSLWRAGEPYSIRYVASDRYRLVRLRNDDNLLAWVNSSEQVLATIKLEVWKGALEA